MPYFHPPRSLKPFTNDVRYVFSGFLTPLSVPTYFSHPPYLWYVYPALNHIAEVLYEWPLFILSLVRPANLSRNGNASTRRKKDATSPVKSCFLKWRITDMSRRILRRSAMFSTLAPSAMEFPDGIHSSSLIFNGGFL